MSQKKRKDEPHFKHWRPQQNIIDVKAIEAAARAEEKYAEYECTKCHCIFEGKDECDQHVKDQQHYSFKLKGTKLILGYV
jgi:uncharacterized C2H2 Zn-finger protein